MYVEVCLVFTLNTMVLALRRGPHHPHGQTPVERAHHHYRPRGADSLTGDAELLHDIKHLEEDSKVLTPAMLSAMKPEELEFHYFSSHDFDGNSKLDGLELLKAIYHTDYDETPNNFYDDSDDIEPEANELSAYVALVDRTLDSDDTNRDGYISYAEYRSARARNPLERTPRVIAAPLP